MAHRVTKRQKEFLEAIYNSLNNEGYPPSFDELKEKLNISSNQAILDHLQALEEKKLIKREEKTARSISITPLGHNTLEVKPLVRMIGTSFAGTFTESIELTGTWVEASQEVKINNDVFLVKIQGDSMINAGIGDGDCLVAQPTQEFVTGDIVVASTAQGSTVKRFILQNKPPFLYLKPENPAYPVLLFTPDVVMQAKIVGKWLSGSIQPPIQGKFL